jgi:hypothetical protein
MYRKLMHRSFNPSAAQMYWETQEREARILVDNIIKFPESLVKHLRRQGFSVAIGDLSFKNSYRNAASVIMQIAYGYPVTRNDDHFVVTAEEHMRIGEISQPQYRLE